jgi:hypothetical protein
LGRQTMVGWLSSPMVFLPRYLPRH